MISVGNQPLLTVASDLLSVADCHSKCVATLLSGACFEPASASALPALICASGQQQQAEQQLQSSSRSIVWDLLSPARTAEGTTWWSRAGPVRPAGHCHVAGNNKKLAAGVQDFSQVACGACSILVHQHLWAAADGLTAGAWAVVRLYSSAMLMGHQYRTARTRTAQRLCTQLP